MTCSDSLNESQRSTKRRAKDGIKNAEKVNFDMLESAAPAELYNNPEYYERKMETNIRTLAEALAK